MRTNPFASRHEPLFLNGGSFHSELVLQKMEALRSVVDKRDAERLERDIALLKSGIVGEKRVVFELQNSHYPLVFLHDLSLEHEGATAQVDFLVISPSNAFVLECKNLVGDIEVQHDGTFVRTFGAGSRRHREAIYSPVTQNTRHVELMKAIIRSENGRLMSGLLGGALDTYFQSIIVLANDKTVLFMGQAPKDIRSQIVRCDQLVEHIKRLDDAYRKANGKESFTQIKRNAQGWLRRSTPIKVDLASKYTIARASVKANNSRAGAPEKTASPLAAQPVPDQVAVARTQPTPIITNPQDAAPVCPVCGSPMQLRKARYGAHKGEQFWGCSTYWATRCPGIITIGRSDPTQI